MGNLKSKKAKKEAESAKAASRKIDQNMMGDMEEDKRVMKLLLLGAGESGKSTLFKQATKLYGEGFDEQQISDYAKIIYGNALSGMCILCRQSEIMEEEKCRSLPENKDALEYFLALDATDDVEDMEITPEAHNFVKTMWADPGIKLTFEKRSLFQIPDSVSYFFDEIDRIAEKGYTPSHDDILRCRARTTGIIESRFAMNNTHFRLMDVGGQRSERKKWIHCFEEVMAVLFVAAINEFDQKCFEDNQTNRVLEALDLFDQTCNKKWFANASIILFLNKRDLFEEKIKAVDLNVLFEEYTGGHDYDAAVDFLTEKFKSQNRTPGVDIYHHVTCATDTENVQFTFDAVKKIVLAKSLEDSGLGGRLEPRLE